MTNSVNTNVGAMVALQNLNSTNNELQTTQALQHRRGNTREVIALGEEQVGVVLAEAFINVGLHLWGGGGPETF